MASPATSTHLPPLAEPHQRAAVGRELEATTSSQPAPVVAEAVEDRIVVSEMTYRVSQVGERAREHAERLGELDAVSQDVLIEVVRALEEQQWMLRAQLTGRG
jgi:starvation-inducible DNA-binding protein